MTWGAASGCLDPVCGYAGEDGTPGPTVSGMSHGAMIIFDATPPTLLAGTSSSPLLSSS
jgi:hypothetical protein